MARLAVLAVAASLVLARAAPAEIYRWTDADGVLHFSQDLGQVPPEHRAAAREWSPAESPASLQTYESPQTGTEAANPRAGNAIRIPFQRQGTLMAVEAVVNDRRRVPFLIDTGASGISIPRALARELGIRVHAGTPEVTVRTASGLMRVPIVRLDSVQLGTARVEGLHATLNPALDIGLLGGSFFNNFAYSVDAAASVITLVPNEGVRAGAAAEQWRERFQALRTSIHRLESYLHEREVTRDGRRRALEQNLAELKEDLADLELEANRANVPQAWRQ